MFLNAADAQPKIAQSVLGYAYDADSHAVRAVRGIPGAALLSDPLDAGFEPSSAAVSPSGEYALAVAASGDVWLVRWKPDLAAAAVNGAMPAPDSIVFSPAGAAAILYDSRSGRAQLVTGVPDAPVVRELPPAASAAIAVSDSAMAALATPEGVQLIAPDQTIYSLPLPATPAVLTFDRGGSQLLAVAPTGELYVASRPEAGLDVLRIPSDPAGTLQPVAAQFSAGASAVIVATSTGAVVVVDAQTGAMQAVDCHCGPTLLQPFGRAGLYRLTDISSRPIMLIDTAPDTPRLWFVPPAAGRSAQ